MNKDDIKMIVSDLDGTLVSTGSSFKKDTDDFFNLLNEKGIIFVPATGRAHKMVLAGFEGTRCHAEYDISINGALLCRGNEVIYNQSLEKTDYEESVRYAVNHDITVLLHAKECTYFLTAPNKNDEPNEFLEMVRRGGEKAYHDFKKNGKFIRSIDEINEPILKYELYKEDCSCIPQCISDLKELGQMEIVSADSHNVEGTKIGVSKGGALEYLLKYLGLQKDEVIVCGDSGNDLAMMKVGCHNVCPSNATNEIKEMCEVITDSCDNNGVEQYLINLLK